MDLLDLIDTLAVQHSSEAAIIDSLTSYEHTVLYMIDSLLPTAELAFLDAEKVGSAVFEKEGHTYYQFFLLSEAVEFISDALAHRATADAIAHRMIEYSIHDA